MRGGHDTRKRLSRSPLQPGTQHNAGLSIVPWLAVIPAAHAVDDARGATYRGGTHPIRKSTWNTVGGCLSH